MVDPDARVSRSCSTAASTTTTSCGASSNAAGYRFFSGQRHRGDPQGVRPLGRATSSTTSSACSHSRSTSATPVASCSPATASASSRCTSPRCPAPCASRRRLPALVAGGGRRHVDRSGRAAPLPHVPRGRARAAHDPVDGVTKLPPATLLVVEPDGRRSQRRYWSVADRRDDPALAASRRRVCRTPSTMHCAAPSSGAWWPTSRSACCSPVVSTRA